MHEYQRNKEHVSVAQPPTNQGSTKENNKIRCTYQNDLKLSTLKTFNNKKKGL